MPKKTKRAKPSETPRKRKDAKKRKKSSLARRADRYDLYQRSVQEPECEVDFFDEVYRSIHRRRPIVLREDFCGTFAVACDWVRRPGRRAVAVDIDPEPLAWGREHNLAALGRVARERLTIRQRDVRTVADEKADVLCAENFSYWIFQTRDALRTYFEFARQNLAEGGIFVLDLMGGPDCYVEKHPDRRKLDGFTYLWELESFDPIDHAAVHHIHFQFRDGSRMKRAFTYRWRFWTIPEIREILAEAGFRSSTVYWEGTDKKTGEGDGVWKPATKATADPSWVAYVVARTDG